MNVADKRMLVIRFSALGDVAMTIPAIYSLAEKYPQLHIDVVTRPFFARLFINAPENVSVHGVDLNKEYKGVNGTVRLLKYLASLKPDYIADLHNVLRTWVIDQYFKLRGVKVEMVDKLRKNRKDILKKGISQPNFIDRYVEVFSRLGYPVTLTFDSLFPVKPKKHPVEIQHPAIGIAPFARYYNKTYPPAMMKEAVDMLTAEGYNVYLFGGRGKEAEELAHWQAGSDKCTSLAGRFSLEEELALMGEMDLMVSMDSANQHMAGLAGTKVLSIWGSTTPGCGFLGYRQTKDNALCLNIECQPCTVAGSPECPLGHLNCLTGISPKSIVSKIKTLLG